jgi:hypothetical protein
MVPSMKGYKGAPTPVTQGIDALPAASRGIAVLTKLDASRRTFAGTQTKLYEGVGTTWNDISAAGDYNLGPEERWLFVQFGNATIAAAKTETLQFSVTGAFADISGAPKAKHLAVSQGFIMVADTNDGTYGDQSDRWWCCAYLDYTDWVPDVSTQCVTGRLVDSPGPIYAMEALGANFISYKKDSIFIGQYVGAPSVWEWTQVPGYVGCLGKEVVINTGYAHIFLGSDDFYLMDGTRPISIGAPIREWFFANLNSKYAYKVQSAYDEEVGNAYWWYVPRTNSQGTLTSAIVYNVKSKKWGKLDLEVESVSKYETPGVTYNGMGTLFTTYADLPNGVAYNSPYWSAETPVLSVMKTDHILYGLTGAPTSCSFQTGIVGSDTKMLTVKIVKPYFITPPTSATLEVLTDNGYGNSFSTRKTVTMSRNRFNVLSRARWHRFVATMVGNVEVIGNTYDTVESGNE